MCNHVYVGTTPKNLHTHKSISYNLDCFECRGSHKEQPRTLLIGITTIASCIFSWMVHLAKVLKARGWEWRKTQSTPSLFGHVAVCFWSTTCSFYGWYTGGGWHFYVWGMLIQTHRYKSVILHMYRQGCRGHQDKTVDWKHEQGTKIKYWNEEHVTNN